MRVPSLAALAVICASCADGTSSVITSPDTPSYWRVPSGALHLIARCEFRKTELTLDRGARVDVGIGCYDAGGAYLGQILPYGADYLSDDPAIAAVDSLGHISARSAGTTQIRATHPLYPFNDSLAVTVRGTTAQPAPAPAPAPDSTEDPATEDPTTGPSDPQTGDPTTYPTPSPSVPSPTGPPAPTAGFPNQPSGMIFITDRQFDSKARTNSDVGLGGSDGWDGGEYQFPRFTIVADPSAPNGDGQVGQMYYPANLLAGTGPAKAYVYFPPNVREVYMSVWARISSNWVGNEASINKMFFVGVSGGNNQFVFTAYGRDASPLQARMTLQGVNDPRSFLMPNRGGSAAIVRNQWQRWEFVLKCNSAPNTADGSADLWINGAHVTAAANINWTVSKYPTRPCSLGQFNWNPTYGGGGASPGVNQYLWFDRVYVSGK